MASEQKRLFLFLSLSALILFGWQAYMSPKPKMGVSTVIDSKNNKDSIDSKAVTESIEVKNQKKENDNKEDFKVSLEMIGKNGNNVTVSSDLSILNFKNNSATDVFSSVVGDKKPLRFSILKDGQLIPIRLNEFKNDSNVLRGRDEVNGISFVGSLNDEGHFNWSLVSDEPVVFYITSQSVKKEGDGRQVRQFLSYFKDVERTNIDGNEDFDGKLNWIGIDFHYHLFASVLKSPQASRIKIANEKMDVKLVNKQKSLEGTTYFVKKSYDELEGLNNQLHLSIDFGVFSLIAVPILRGLQFIYKYLPNYGLAIILITLFIRTLLFPLQIKSFKSMKKMQKLQPELAKVKEKFGDDPQRMQRETMELFKKNGASPMGGCLPLILQMPVFFAFYQVLFNSVEMLNAPFIFWIKDLSIKDPYYVLPVLMGLAMFGQTKLNPSTSADPTQKKMMMLMPLVFTFFMKDLPAGLNLYIFVSTIFGIVQQLFVYKTVD